MSRVTVQHCQNNALVQWQRGSVAPPIAPTPNVRPTGAGYVRYEDLFTTGNTLRQVLAKVTNGDVLTFPPGVFEYADFPNSLSPNVALMMPAGCGGLWGSGTDSSTGTVFRMTAGSSTIGASVPTAAGTTNNYRLMGTNHSGTIFKNFQLQGTNQGHFYNGLGAYGSSTNVLTQIVVDTVFFNGAGPGNDSSPPGETFQFATNHTDNCRLVNCTFDGRSAGGGACASNIGWNSSTNAYIESTLTQYGAYGHGVTFWQTTGVHTKNLTSQHNGYSGFGYAVNHENCDGTVLHESPTLLADVANSAHGVHMSLNNSTAQGYGNNPNVSLTNVTHDASQSTYKGCFTVLIKDTYQGSTQTQTSYPTITKSGRTLVGLDSSNVASANTTTNFVRLH